MHVLAGYFTPNRGIWQNMRYVAEATDRYYLSCLPGTDSYRLLVQLVISALRQDRVTSCTDLLKELRKSRCYYHQLSVAQLGCCSAAHPALSVPSHTVLLTWEATAAQSTCGCYKDS